MQTLHRSGRAISSRSSCSPFPDQVAGLLALPVEGAASGPQPRRDRGLVLKKDLLQRPTLDSFSFPRQ